MRSQADALERTATGAVRGYAAEARGLLGDVEGHAVALFAAVNALATQLEDSPEGMTEAWAAGALDPRLADAADRLWSPSAQCPSALQLLALLDPPDALAASLPLTVPPGIVDEVRAAVDAVRWPRLQVRG